MRQNFGRRLPLDPRIVERIMRSPELVGEQVNFMDAWGGPHMYRQLARMPTDQRMTYMAIREGITTPEAIAVATELRPEQVERALDVLERKGLITPGRNDVSISNF